jgi:hypothetical protein
MPSSFTPVNRRAVAQVRAQRVRGRQTSAPTTGVEKRKRQSPTTPNINKLAEQVRKLKDARRGGSLEWPAGISPSNTVVSKVEQGVPEPLANKGRPHDSDEDEFVLYAAASHWPHKKTAAYLGRSPQSVRLTLCRLGKVRDAAERASQSAAEESTETTQSGPSRSPSAATVSGSTPESSPVLQVGQTAESGRLPEPSSSSPVAGPLRDSSGEHRQSLDRLLIPPRGDAAGFFSRFSISYMAAQDERFSSQSSGHTLLEPASYTTLDMQSACSRSYPESICVATGSSARPANRGTDLMGAGALLEAAAILAAQSGYRAATIVEPQQSGYRHAIEVMGIIQAEAA